MKPDSLQECLSTIKQCCIDSRQVERGDLFFALKGERVDGHSFLKDVAARGAVGAVVSKEYQGDSFGLKLFFVDDVVKALQGLARSRLAKWNVRIIGITGSVGKTTTKEFLGAMLSVRFRLYKSPLSYNSQVTLPLNILNAQGDEEVMILEMAMSQAGELSALIEIAPPHYALITKIGRTHTAFFPEGIKGVARAKGEILESPRLQCAVIGAEALRFEEICKRGVCSRVSYGSEGSDYVLKRDGERYFILERGEPSPLFSLTFSAEHLVCNFLGAVAMSRVLGLTWSEILSVSGALKPVSRRFETVMKNGVTFINDCYNASAESTVAALKNLPRPAPHGKTVFVFGEMRELGSLHLQSHLEVGHAAAEVVDQLMCLGEGCLPMMRVVSERGKQVQLFRNFESLKTALFQVTSNGDVVLIKGGNSHQLWRILDT